MISPWVVGENMKQISAVEEKQGEKHCMSYFVIHGEAVRFLGEKGRFFMCFSIFLITPVFPVSPNVIL